MLELSKMYLKAQKIQKVAHVVFKLIHYLLRSESNREAGGGGTFFVNNTCFQNSILVFFFLCARSNIKN